MYNGKLLFLDWKQERLLLCNSDASDSRFLTDLSNLGPFDVTCVSEDKVAVTLRISKTVVLIDFASGKTLQKINVNG
jgi:hypothetical protein